jgi:hypothetical protein
MKEPVASFLSNVLSVILGIVITFTVQGMIDRARERHEVRAALNLVRTELATNATDVAEMTDYLRQERVSANYFLKNLKTLEQCPNDSVRFHSGIIFADATITLSDDALELLKMSSLFQKIGDNDLAMKIIRAYDTCDNIAANLNRHVSQRNERFEESVNEKTAGQFATSGSIDLERYLKTPYGQYAIRWLTTQGDLDIMTDVSDLGAAIDAIDGYLQGRRRHKR